MKRWMSRLVLTAVLVALAATAGLAQKPPRSIYLEIRSVDSGPSGTITSTMKFWATKQSARLDTSHPLRGTQRLLVFKGYVYVMSVDAKVGVKSPLPKELKSVVGDIEKMVHVIPGIPEKGDKLPPKVREETLLGYKCDVHEFSETKDGRTVKVTLWMPKTLRPRIPLKMIESNIIQKKGVNIREKREVRVTKIRLNVPVTEALFRVPKGYKIREQKLPARRGSRPRK